MRVLTEDKNNKVQILDELLKNYISKDEKLKVLSLFSGIGAFEKALTRKNINHEVVAYCEVNKYSSAAYSEIHNVPEEKNLGDISKVNFADIPDCDLITYGFPCFLNGTLVYTSEGYKKIEDVKVGDNVLTHTNTFKKVLRIMDKDADEYLVLKTQVAEEIRVTKNHPFYVKEVSIVDNKTIFSEPQWIAAEDLTQKHYIGIAINKEKDLINLSNYSMPDIYTHKLSKIIDKEEFWWLVGKWSSKKILSDKQVVITADSDYYVSDLIKYRLDSLDIKYKIQVTEDNVCYIINDQPIVGLFNKFAARQEQLLKDITLLPHDLSRNYLNGFLMTNNYVSSKGETIIKLTSEPGAYSLVQIIAKAYKTPYRLTKVEDTYYITIFNEDTIMHNSFYDGDYIWVPIDSITRVYNEEVVYNLEVEEDNSYTVFNLIVHNCQDISNAGKKKGIIKDQTRSGLLFYALDIIKEKRPKYAICENVKNLVGKKFKKDFDNLLKELEDLGYNNYWKVINATNHNIPQSRERVFVISIRKDLEQEYTFPKDVVLDCKLDDILEKKVDEVFYLSKKSIEKLVRHNNKIINGNTPDISRCICAGYYKMGERDQQYIKIKKTYQFPVDKQLTLKLKDVLEDSVDESYYVAQERINVLLKELKDKNCIAVREGTIKGYNEAYEGDSINLDYPNSIVRRGRVGRERTQTLLTSTQICVVEKAKDNKTYLERKLIDYALKNKEVPEFFNAYNQRPFTDVSPTLTTTCGSPTSVNGIVKCEGIQSRNNIITYNIPKKVRTRVYDVDKVKLQKLLSERKAALGLTCREISRRLNVHQALIEHWFRGDDSFAIPHPEIWFNVKELLEIETDEFDKSIITFETKEGNYDKSNRIYDVEGNIPTLTTTCKEHTIVDLETFRIRKLTPLETWRLMGFDDEDYYKAKERLKKQFYNGKDKTNSQMYKMAGNSIVVNVLEDLMEQLLK